MNCNGVQSFSFGKPALTSCNGVQSFSFSSFCNTIELEQPAVLIGPNNSGKTTVILLHKFAVLSREPILLNKGRYYELIKFLPKKSVDSEVIEKLDLLVKYLKY